MSSHLHSDLNLTNVTATEAIQLGAIDPEFFCRVFFPQTFRQESAPFHGDMWKKLESNRRLINILAFRGSAKTTTCRVFTAKRIAYGLSKTILYIGKSEGHAIRSVAWIKKQIETNSAFNKTFQLSPGSKWQDIECEVTVGNGGDSCWLMAAGITGSIRGVNRDDFRPDLIVMDDVLDDENAHTEEQRNKINNLVYGAVLESLAPRSEAEHALLCALNTPQHAEDFSMKALKDPTWVSGVYGCWTPETMHLPIAQQKSSWETRFPSEELRKEKKGAIARNMLSVFTREKECRITSSETASFQSQWLNRYTVLPEGVRYVYAIDPVPPPSDAAVAKGIYKTDFEAHVIWAAHGDNRYLVEYRLMRGHEPTWTIAQFFELQQKYRPYRTLVEAVAYQRTLMWLLRQAMNTKRMWFFIEEWKDKRSKFNRILSAHNGLASAGRLFVRDDQIDFITQFGEYPAVANDDLLDASATALGALDGLIFFPKGDIHHVADDSDEDYDRQGAMMTEILQRAP